MKLGIIAGNGQLPGLLAAHCRVASIPFHLFAIGGQGSIPAADVPSNAFRLGAISTLARMLRQQEVTDIVFIGGIRKPGLWALRPDWMLLKNLPTLGLFRHGDDGLLRRVASRFERALGIRVRGIHEFMPGLLAPAGQFGDIALPAAGDTAVELGVAAARRHGLRDRGQAVIADGNAVLAYEGKDGTAAMLRRFAAAPKPGAILVKLVKPQQDLRLDLPTIGPETVRQAHAASLSGIVVSAGKTLVVDQAQTTALADEAGLFLLGLAHD